MKRHHALLLETVGVMASQGMMALQRRGRGKWESVSRSDKSVFMLERGAVAGYVVRRNALQAAGRSPKK